MAHSVPDVARGTHSGSNPDVHTALLANAGWRGAPSLRAHTDVSVSGGPAGSGKTAIIEAVTPLLLNMGARVLIVTNDVVTTEDAKHVQRTLKGTIVASSHARAPLAAHKALYWEEAIPTMVLMPGRKHKNREVFQYDVFSSLVRAERPDGSELFVEKLVIEPWKSDVRQPGVMQGFDVLGNVLLLTGRPAADRILAELPAACGATGEWAAGAGRLPHDAGVVYKVLGPESHVVLGKVYEFVTLVRRVILGVEAPFRRPHY